MTIFYILYFIFAYAQSIPQIVKLIRKKSSNDYSLTQRLLQFIAGLCWDFYVFTSPAQETIIYVGSVIDTLLMVITGYLIIKYYNPKKRKTTRKRANAKKNSYAHRILYSFRSLLP